MRRVFLTFILLFCFFVTGCSVFSFAKKKPSTTTVTFIPSYLQDAHLINSELLRKGGNLLISSFLPGTEVAAGPEADNVSVMVVRGFMDVYESQTKEFQKSKIDLIFSDKEQKPDFILDGSILAMDVPSFFQKWFLFKHKMTLTIEGQLKEKESGRIVFVFKDTQVARLKGGDWTEMGRKLGQNLAKWILAEEERQSRTEIIK
ncbi:MAG: hypothetical protein HQL26_06260 [Candidatus Omnitrophica bacterium]|nr:hypothetical protein [Candidatus Omnitrophota bacterium]